jgi:OmpA-OmpF porin, OOP family
MIWGASAALAACATAPAPAPSPVAEVLPIVSESGPPAYRVFFDLNAADITADAAAILNQAVKDYQKLRPVRLVLAGHADRSGAERYNKGLSRRRAEAVRDYLVGVGIAPETLAIEAHGERQGLVSTSDGAVEPQNRRVEIFVRPD